MEKKKKTAAQQRATKKYDSAKYDRVCLLLPKGTKERIKERSESVNGFVVSAVLDALEKLDFLQENIMVKN